MNEHVEIAEIKKEDLSELQKIAKETFEETFEKDNDAQNMSKYIEEKFSTSQIMKEYSNSESFFYLAKYNGQVAGYLKLNCGNAQTENQDQNGIEIERIYVLSEFQGKKIGLKLMGKAIDFARNANKKFIWLGVWEENKKAIKFYEKNNFQVFGEHLFVLGDEEQIDIMMKLNL